MTAASPAVASASPLDPFSIAASESLQQRRPATLKHGDTFAMFNGSGDVPPGIGVPEGLYHRDTRHLSLFDLTLCGARPMLLSSAMRDDNATLTCDLTNPDIEVAGGITLDHDLIHVRRTKFVFEGSCYERIAVRNFDDVPRQLVIEIRFAADFCDLFEVRGRSRPVRGEVAAPQVGADRVVLGYTGLDAAHRTTTLRFEPAPAVLQSNRAMFHIELPAGGRTTLHVEVSCNRTAFARTPLADFFVALRDARRAQRATASRAASIDTDNEVFNELARRCICDLTMLTTDTEHGPYPYAGIPWFSTAFGRDGLLTAQMMLWLDPAMARGVLRFLAAHQATEIDAARDAEPGKILHEMRHGEMAACGEVPFGRYYGSVDSTPLFVVLAGAYFARTGDVATLRELWPNILAALQWIDGFGDRDGDGFLEYFRQTDKGLANQGWKDSYDSVFHRDGAAALAPIALCEVQGYVYAAKVAAGDIAHALGEDDRAHLLREQAATLRLRIDSAFWEPTIGNYALALDRDKRACAVRSSNAGHLLYAGVPDAGRAHEVAAQLLGTNFFSGWGVRTLAVGEPRYNPISYHNGSVWPHDNAVIALGFGRYGLREQAARLLEGMFAAASYIDLRRLPELVCGFPRRQGQGPTFYPVACAPQAWAAAAPVSLLQSCIGITFDPAASIVHFDRPVLPRFTDRVTLRGLRIGENSIDVALHRSGAAVAMTVLSRRGNIRATMTA